MSLINLIVLRCQDVARTRRFYECLELEFSEHQHGDGPIHAGATDDMRLLIELSPATSKSPVDCCGIGLAVQDLEKVRSVLVCADFAPGPIQDQPRGQTFVIRDSDGRRVEIKQHAEARSNWMPK